MVGWLVGPLPKELVGTFCDMRVYMVQKSRWQKTIQSCFKVQTRFPHLHQLPKKKKKLILTQKALKIGFYFFYLPTGCQSLQVGSGYDMMRWWFPCPFWWFPWTCLWANRGISTTIMGLSNAFTKKNTGKGNPQMFLSKCGLSITMSDRVCQVWMWNQKWISTVSKQTPDKINGIKWYNDSWTTIVGHSDSNLKWKKWMKEFASFVLRLSINWVFLASRQDPIF